MLSQDDAIPTLPDSPRRDRDKVSARRFIPTYVYALAEHVKRIGVDLRRIHGPWRSSEQPLQRPGRNASDVIPIVTDGVAELAVDTPERAVDLSGFLNWSGVGHLEPVPNLRPPSRTA